MKIEINQKFAVSLEWKDCFKEACLTDLRAGSLFADEGETFSKGYRHQFIKQITKIEPLKIDPNLFAISSIIVGGVVSLLICEKFKKGFWSHKLEEFGGGKFVIMEYYGENCSDKSEKERTELFTCLNLTYYIPNLDLIKKKEVLQDLYGDFGYRKVFIRGYLDGL
jgi:hypothetical protein